MNRRLNELGEAAGKASNQNATNQMIFMPANNIDPNRFCQVEKDLKKIREETEFQTKDLIAQFDAFKIKMDHLDEKLFSSLNQKHLKTMVSQDQMRRTREEIEQDVQDKLADLHQQELEKDQVMNKKMNAVKEIEKRLNKLLKEYDFY